MFANELSALKSIAQGFSMLLFTFKQNKPKTAKIAVTDRTHFKKSPAKPRAKKAAAPPEPSAD